LGAYRFALAWIVFSSHIVPRPLHFMYTMVHGLIAVMMFFVLSGYLISNALETFYAGRVGQFVINRCLRIYPAYWVVFGVTIAICGLYGDPLPGFGGSAILTLQGAPLSDLATAPFTFNIIAMTWSLRCELYFYIAIALTYAVVGSVSWGNPRYKAWGIYLSCFAALGYHAYCSASWDIPWAHPYAHIPFFVVGVAVSRLMLRRDPPVASFVLLGCAVLLAFISFSHNVYPAPHQRLFVPFGLRLGPDPFNLINFAILVVLFVAGLMVSVGGYLRRVDNFLGDLSYPLFISHYTVVAMVGYAFANVPDTLRVWLAVALALAVAVLLWWAVDRQVVWLRDRVRGGELYPARSAMAVA
jgi:peptidoglycan/LPS O-acetylase OafA/YrhL